MLSHGAFRNCESDPVVIVNQCIHICSLFSCLSAILSTSIFLLSACFHELAYYPPYLFIQTIFIYHRSLGANVSKRKFDPRGWERLWVENQMRKKVTKDDFTNRQIQEELSTMCDAFKVMDPQSVLEDEKTKGKTKVLEPSLDTMIPNRIKVNYEPCKYCWKKMDNYLDSSKLQLRYTTL